MNAPTGTPWSIAHFAVSAVIIFVGAVLMLHRLGDAPICGYNEAVEALAVQRMVERGEILAPEELGSEPMYKPPLFHWTATLIDKALGYHRVTEFNLRLTSACFGLMGLVFTMGLAARLLGFRGALVSGLTLLASYQYISQARYGRVDMALTFFETLALILFIAALNCLRTGGEISTAFRVLRWLTAAALGGAVLAKGPVGAILPFSAVVLWTLANREGKKTVSILSLGSVTLFAVIALSWYAACIVTRQYGTLTLQVGAENFGRFFGSLGRMPGNYYLVPLFLNSGPLSVLATVAAFTSLINVKVPREGIDTDELSPDLVANLFGIFWFVTVVFFSLAAYKRKAYLLPLWPANAFLIAWWVKRESCQRGWVWLESVLVGTCICLILFNFFFIPWHERRNCADSYSFKRAALVINSTVDRAAPLFIKLNRGGPVLAFYLDRPVHELDRPLSTITQGYAVTTPEIWHEEVKRDVSDNAAASLCSILTIPGRPELILLSRTEASSCKRVINE